MDQERPLEGLSIFVVEDEFIIADELKRLLQAHGAENVRLSGHLADAAHQIKKGGFEVALLDINIHGERVYSLADQLRQRNVPFAFFTGYDRGELPARFADVPLWSKPFDDRPLMQNVQKLRESAAPPAEVLQ